MRASGWFLSIIGFLFFSSCGKSEEEILPVCSLSGTSVIFTVTSDTGTLRKEQNEYYLVAQNSIDSRLYPCNLPDSFRQEGLRLRYSGRVYESAIRTNAPCCAYAMELGSVFRF